MNKNILIMAVIVVVLIALGIVYLGSAKKTEPVAPVEGSSAAITNDLNGLDLGDLNSDFKDIDATVNGL